MRTLPAILLISLTLGVAGPRPSAAADKRGTPPFLLFVTVFNEQGYGFRGAKARLRRADEKKDRWQAQSDRRGEFAMRVPQGSEYELSVSAKGYRTEVRKVDARQATRLDLTLRLEPASKDKKADGQGSKAAQDQPPKEKRK